VLVGEPPTLSINVGVASLSLLYWQKEEEKKREREMEEGGGKGWTRTGGTYCPSYGSMIELMMLHSPTQWARIGPHCLIRPLCLIWREVSRAATQPWVRPSSGYASIWHIDICEFHTCRWRHPWMHLDLGSTVVDSLLTEKKDCIGSSVSFCLL